MMKNTNAKKDLVNTVMYEAQNEAAYDFLDSIELVSYELQVCFC
jgi:hypothetical protein